MAAISRRTIFYEIGAGGEYRFHDWAMVNTNLGMMLEPRPTINPIKQGGTSGAVRDYTDDITRVDDFAPMSLDRSATILSEIPITGGPMFSRKGR